MQMNAGQTSETYLKKLKLGVSIQPVGDVQLIVISGFIQISQELLKLMMHIFRLFNLQNQNVSSLTSLSI